MRRSASEVCQALSAAVLLLRSGAATSRSSLARVLGVAPSTGGQYVDTLIESGFASESGFEQGPMGRPKRALALRPSVGWFAGVEFYAARIQAVRVDFAGEVKDLHEVQLPQRPEAQAVVEGVAGSIQRLVKNAGERLLGIGIGAPGLVDPSRGYGRDYRFISDWRDVAIGDALCERFGVPVTLENNLRAVTMAEQCFGDGRTLNDFVCLGIRSGFGVGIVAGGKLLAGAQHTAGEIGRWLWPIGANGSRRELQEVLSAPAILRRVMKLSEQSPVPTDLRSAFAKIGFVGEDGGVLEAWKGVVEDLSQVITSLHLLLNPGAFFLHGPLTVLGNPLCDALVKTTLGSHRQDEVPLRIRASKLGDEAGALGAASIAMEAWLPEVRATA